MQKKTVLSLIRSGIENDDAVFHSEAYKVAQEFDSNGDSQLAEYVMTLLAGWKSENVIIQKPESVSPFFQRLEKSNDMLWLPDAIISDLSGVANAIEHHMGLSKFLFQGAPGTGKTEAVKQLARLLDREVYLVDFAAVIDSRLGQTQKNLSLLFRDISSLPRPDKLIILFDEIDALALDRINSNDLREMGRAVSTLLKEMDRLNENVILISTTNLYEYFDKALIRRFDAIINFNRYSRDDLLLIAEKMLDHYLDLCGLTSRDVRLFRKIMKQLPQMPYPGDLKNLIKTAVAFSNPCDSLDYLRRLYYAVCREKPEDPEKLRKQKFTTREIGILAK